MKKNKILFVVSSTDLVGVARHCLNLILDLTGQYEIGLVVRRTGWLTEQLSEKCSSVKIYNLESKLNFQSVVNVNKKVKEIAGGYDFVHMHGRYSLFICSLLLLSRRNVKYIYTLHQFFSLSDDGFFSIKKKFEKGLINRVDTLISVSDSLGEETTSIFPEHEHIVINNYSIPNHNVDHYAENKGWVNKSTINIIMVGRLSKEKGFASVLPVFSSLRTSVQVRCDIYGDGEERCTLLRIIDEYQLSDCVSLKGVSSDIYSSLLDADIVLIPSFSESFSLVAIEAMLSKKIVLARDIPGLNNVVIDYDNGFLFKNDNDINDIISVIIENDELRNGLINNAYAIALEKYSFKSVKHLYDKVYQ
ncbi:glycosyltransferase family 4 protein [Vibrio cyclitrophicus]